MASRTLKMLSDLIKVERPEIRSNPDFPQAVITRLVNDAQKYVQIELAHLGIKRWESSDSLTLSSPGAFGAGSIVKSSLSSDCPSMLESPKAILFIAVSDGTNSGIAYERDPNIFEAELLNSYSAPTVTNPAFMRLANQIYLAPSTVTSATAYYYKAVTDLANDSDPTTIPENYEEFIVKRVLIEVDGILQKLNNKVEAINQLTKDIQDSFQSFGFIKQEEPKKVELQ